MSSRRHLPKPAVLIIGVGTVLMAVAAGHHWEEVATLNQQVGPLAAFVLDGVLAVGIVCAGYWLSRTDLETEGQWTVLWWSLVGGFLFATVTGLTVAIRAHEGRAITEPTFSLLVATESGVLAGLVAGYNTVRARRAAEQARAANARLERANRNLERSNERLEQFASMLSHDLQEPLRMVSSYLQLLERRYADDLDEEAGEFIDFAVDGATRMQEMVDGLLEYARVTSSEKPLEPTDANDVLDAVLDDLQLRIEETDATVTADDLPTVQADRTQLMEVFRNLLENALRHRGEEPPRVHVGATPADEMWQFSVRDDGVGIDPDQQDRIFEMFEQGNAKDRGSAGIGLALCERIIEQHGGDIWVESEPGEGTTFSFTLRSADDGRR
ncbi:MAG: ATP-binding protein [Halolamina sp.]